MSVLLADAGFQRILAGDGFVISLTGMAVVFFSLILTSLAIAMLPRLLNALEGCLPDLESHGHGGGATTDSAAGPGSATAEAAREQLVAAIGFALHSRKP